MNFPLRLATGWRFLMLGFLLATAHGSQRAARLESAVSLLKNWSPDQHLYLNGEIAIAAGELDQLEQWLDQKGPNWTVLLSQNVRTESFRDAFGRNLKGIDAVEHALMNGLQAQTKFSELRDPRTGLANGVLLIIFIEERKFSYFGGEHYSRNGASAKQWPNNLDAAARRAMQNGGRLVEAVKNTVTSIDQRVARTIQNRESARTAQVARAKEELANLESHLATVSEKQAAMISELDGEGGDIARLPINEMKTKIDILRERPGTYDISRFRADLVRWEGWLDHYVTDAKQITHLEEQLAITSATSEDGKASLAKARSLMDQASEHHQKGNFSYQQLLSNTESHLSAASLQDESARRASEKKSFAIKAAGTTGSGLLVIIAIAGNRRRQKIKAQADNLLASRKLEMKETEDRLFELMDRSSVIVGPIDELENRGYTGDTLNLSRRALSRIDEAFVLSSNVQKIIEEAEGLIEPGNPLSRSRNLISRGRYEDAVDLLDAELNVGLKDVPLLRDRTRPGEEVDETFSLPIDTWQERTAEALNTASISLDKVEEAWSTIVSRSENLSENIESLKAKQDEVQIDDWLRCEATFDDWIPAMSHVHQRAASTGKSDPVLALSKDMNLGDRMASEAGDLLNHITSFRQTCWEDLQANEAILDQRKRTTLWVDDSLIELNRHANRLALESEDADVSTLVGEVASGLSGLSSQVAKGADLIVRADEKTQATIKNAESLVRKIRREIGIALDLEPGDVVIEEGLNPSDFLKKARLQHDASFAALDLGEIESAEGFLNEVDALAKHAKRLAMDSRKILDDYAGSSEALWQQRGALVEKGEKMNHEAEALRFRYAPRALFLDPDIPGSGTYADSPAQLEGLLKGIVKRLERAKKRFGEGGLLEARDLIINGVTLATEGRTLCAEITNRSKILHALEETNTSTFEKHRRAQADLNGQMQDRRITRQTLTLFETICSKLDQTEREINAGDGRRDPYLVEDLLEELGERLPNLRQDIAADFEEHSRTLQLFETVSRNRQEAIRLWETADNDRIANSPTTNVAMTAIETCHAQLNEVHGDLEIDHADWRKIQTSLRTLHLSLSEASLSLNRELTLARESVRAIDAATREVHKAARWSGSHGIRISGNYGSRSLSAANDVMQHGLYQEALRMAGQARTRARRAIADAEAREAAKRRAEEAARRRRREASRRSSFSSHSNFGSSSSISQGGSRSSSSSSGMGRSSFGSGSGMGRSGW